MSKARSLIEARNGEYLTDVEVDTFGNPPKLPKEVYLAHRSKVNIKWSLDEEHRSWGIKGLSPVIPDQEVELTYIEATEDEDIEHTFTWKIVRAEYKMEAADDITSLQLIPITLEIDFNKNKSTVLFKVS